MNAGNIKLKCGINAVLVPCEAESVAFGIFVAQGSRYESPADAGISHFIEHMLFKGTAKRKAIDISKAIEGRGGNFNAFTGEEGTCFFAHMPSEYLGEAVDILSDMYLNASFPDDEFAREKGVIIEEIKMYNDDPDNIADENLQAALFPLNPLGAPVAGSEETVGAMTASRLKKYMHERYLSENTTLVLVGAFDPDVAAALLESAFPVRKGRERKPASPQQIDLSIPPTCEIKVSRELQQVKLAIGHRTFGCTDPRRFAVVVMDAILGKGMSSRLFQEVREKRGLSYNISSNCQFFDEVGMFVVRAGLSASNVDKALATIYREFDKIKTRKVSKAELKRTKEFLIGNFRLGHEKIISKLIFYGSMFMSYGRVVNPADIVEAIRAVTTDDILAAANSTLADGNKSISWVLPR